MTPRRSLLAAIPIAPAICCSGTTWQAAPASTAAPCIPNTTLDASSWATVQHPPSRNRFNPAAPSRAQAPSRSPLFPRFPSSAMYDRVAELGPRHLEILELVLSGCTNQEISGSTQLALGTVKNYVSSLLLALDVKSRSHLVSLFR